MARIKNTMKLIKQTEGCINKNYSLYASNIDDIYKESNDPYMLIINSFRFGYNRRLLKLLSTSHDTENGLRVV